VTTKTGVSLLEPTDGVATVGGHPFVVPSAENSAVSRRLMASGHTEREFSEAIRHVVYPRQVVVDLGANIGYFTSILAQEVGTHGRVLAFEPVPHARTYLAHNVAINNLHQVTVDARALADWRGAGAITLPAFRLEPQAGAGEVGLEVQVSTFDMVAQEYDLDRLDLVKIDIEGSELRALSGMERSLRRWRPLLAVETHAQFLPLYGDDMAALHAFLDGIGYGCAFIDDHRLVAAPRDRLQAHRLLPSGQVRPLFCSMSADDWHTAPDSKLDVADAGSGARFEFDLGDRGHQYVFTDSPAPQQPPVSARRWPLTRGRYAGLQWQGEVSDGAVCSAWVFQYDIDRRVASHMIPLLSDSGEWPVIVHDRARSFRVALRFSGSGSVHMERLCLIESEPARPLLATAR
jgi:FkbM family methyltransferase